MARRDAVGIYPELGEFAAFLLLRFVVAPTLAIEALAIILLALFAS